MSDGFSRREFLEMTAVGVGLGLPALAGGAEGGEARGTTGAARADDLPPRTLIEPPPLRPVPEWVRREEVIPIHGVRVLCRRPDVRKATLQPEGLDLPLNPIKGGVEVSVPVVLVHSMVVFETGTITP